MQVLAVDFTDATTTASKVQVLDSGAIRIRGRLARTGVQEYDPSFFGSDCPIKSRKVRVYRPESEVTSKKSLATLDSTAVTVGHPQGKKVTRSNWKRLAVGTVEGRDAEIVELDGEKHIEAPMVIYDEDTVLRIDSEELVEISQGYSAEIVWQDGVDPNGNAHDCIMKNIVQNHTALLQEGRARAGSNERVLTDEEEMPLTPEELETIANKVVDISDARRANERAERKKKEAEIAKAKEEGKKEAEQAAKPEEKEPEEKEPEETTVNDSDAGAALVKKAIEARADAQVLVDCRDAAQKMVPKGTDLSKLGLREVRELALKSCLDLDLTDATDEAVAGAFDALKANETVYIVSDSTPSKKEEKGESLRDVMARKGREEFEKAGVA